MKETRYNGEREPFEVVLSTATIFDVHLLHRGLDTTSIDHICVVVSAYFQIRKLYALCCSFSG